MATDLNLYRLTSPRIFLVRMLAFLILAGFVALVLNRQIANAFMANPGLNGLIFAILAIGVALALLQVGRLMREVRWANALGTSNMVKPPVLLAPVATILGEDFAGRSISTVTLRALLDSIGQRLDEQREIGRYLVGLLVFLGLLGTFWGLLETVGSIGDVIKSMQTGGDSAVMFDDLKNGLAAPIAGMSISFTSSLFGLAGSLILGFLDLQAGQAQNRFFTELEDRLATQTVDVGAPDLDAAFPGAGPLSGAAAADQSQALASLAQGIQGLVQHMRNEQQLVRKWMEAQADQQREVKKLLERLASETEPG